MSEHETMKKVTAQHRDKDGREGGGWGVKVTLKLVGVLRKSFKSVAADLGATFSTLSQPSHNVTK